MCLEGSDQSRFMIFNIYKIRIVSKLSLNLDEKFLFVT